MVRILEEHNETFLHNSMLVRHAPSRCVAHNWLVQWTSLVIMAHSIHYILMQSIMHCRGQLNNL